MLKEMLENWDWDDFKDWFISWFISWAVSTLVFGFVILVVLALVVTITQEPIPRSSLFEWSRIVGFVTGAGISSMAITWWKTYKS